VYEGLPAVCEPNEGYKLDGEPCLSDASCASNTCRTFGANRLCTRACATTSPGDCTSGTRCVAEAGTEQGLCWPTLYTDPDARDPTRTSRTIPATYCSCDSSNECDEDCECDPECEGSSCSCRSVGRGVDPVDRGLVAGHFDRPPTPALIRRRGPAGTVGQRTKSAALRGSRRISLKP
jgi:hypothetical protein